MVEKLVNKLVVKRENEDIVNYVFRKQRVRNRITDFIEDTVAGFIIAIVLAIVLLVGITRPVEGHWEPVYDNHGIVIDTVWVEH